MRILRALGAVVGVLLLAGLVAFPTDNLVRQAVARLNRPGSPALVFRRAVLRPWGLRLDEVALRNPDGTAFAAADWIRVRPSLWGFLRLDYLGRPWAVFAGLCHGTIDAGIDAQAAGLTVTAEWRGLDLDCPPLARFDFKLSGRTDGTASVRLVPRAQPAGSGRLALHAASLRAGSRQSLPAGLQSLTADTASVHWTLANGLLAVDDLAWHGPELEAAGDGRVRLAGALTHSELDLRLTVAAGPHPPELIERALTSLPPARDGSSRSLVVRGTIEHPKAVLP